jgi:DNA repair protein RadA/Sms
MKSQKVVFVCQECGSQSPKWVGRCPECGAWNSFVEESPAPAPIEVTARGAAKAWGGGGSRLYEDVDTVVAERIPSGISEFDRVLGGGIVPGSLVLLGGEPGIGKSALLLQAASHFASHVGPVLYCSGEESGRRSRCGRQLGVGNAPLYLLAETCIERLLESRSPKTGAPHRRFDPDSVFAEAAVGPGKRQRIAAGRHRRCSGQRGICPRCSWGA